MPDLASNPFGKTLRRMFRRTRLLDSYEWTMDMSRGPGIFEIRIHAPRTPTRFELQTPIPLEVTKLCYGTGENAESVDFTTSQSAPANDQFVVGCEPVSPRETRLARIHVSGHIEALTGGNLTVRVVNSAEPDLALMADAEAAANRGDWRRAVDLLQEWVERYSADHIGICSCLANWSRKLGWLHIAEEYSARAVVNQPNEETASLYRMIRTEDFAVRVPELRQLQKDATGWPTGSLHGAVVLERSRRHLLGLGAAELHKSRLVLEIRRAAAARMMSQLSFHIQPTRELLLYTSLQVIHANDEIEAVPDERFSLRDADQENPWRGDGTSVQAGHWIPPDLARGDLVVLEHDLAHRTGEVNGESRIFSVLPIFDPTLATFQARCEFVSPESHPVRFAVRNSELEPEREVREDGRIVHTFTGERHTPAKRTGFRLENNWLNPLVACASLGPDWPQVGPECRAKAFGKAPLEEKPPAPLRHIVDTTPAEHALEKAFCWTRDKLRYAAVQSIATRIGEPDRGRKVVEAGVGDCKDKCYLLALVCRSLGVPFEFVFVASEEGVLIEELPADQFDHVLLRARVGDRWLYLDATDQSCAFGSAPVALQGIQALAVADAVTIVEIPIDAPTSNRIRIRECLQTFRKGRVSGNFKVDATGQIAREGAENWKALSLSTEDPVAAGFGGLTWYLPGALVDDYDRTGDTADSGRFLFEGIHSRGPLTELERHQRRMLPLAWDVPTLPRYFWRMLDPARLFVFHLPMVIEIELRIEGEVRQAMDDFSRIENLDNEIASIEEEIVEGESELEIHRTVVVKKKFVRGEETKLVPGTLEQIEKALRLVASCRMAEGDASVRPPLAEERPHGR